MTMTMQLEIVSAQEAIFSGKITRMTVSGQEGELGIHPGHTALLTGIKPGEVLVIKADGLEEVFYVSGGMLEVQPEVATILADTVQRGDDIDALAAKEAADRASEMLTGMDRKNPDYQKTLIELSEAVAQMKTLKSLQKIKKI